MFLLTEWQVVLVVPRLDLQQLVEICRITLRRIDFSTSRIQGRQAILLLGAVLGQVLEFNLMAVVKEAMTSQE